MTSQLFLFNQRCAVVASDTLTSHRNNHGGWSSSPNNSKIFTLGEQHRLAIASSDCAQVAKFHVERLIHEWASSLAEPFDTLGDYVDSFTRWASSTLNNLGLDHKTNALVVIRHELKDLVGITGIRKLASAHSRGEVDDTASEAQMVEILKIYAAENFVCSEFEDLPMAKAKILVQTLKKKVVKLFAEATGESNRTYSPGFKNELIDFFSNLICRFVPATEGMATLNFIGFGSDVLFPGRIRIDIRGFYAGKIRFRVREIRNGGSDSGPAFQSNAQSSAIDAFTNGMDDNFRWALTRAADQLLSKITTVTDDERHKFRKELDGAVNEIVGQHFVNPFLAALSGMSMTQMVQLADQLIQLQCLRSQLAECDVTVGGPVEVVSITRHEGVVWHRAVPATALT